MRIPSSKEIEYYRSRYPAGTRICCDCMSDDPRPIPPGTMGTVVGVDDMCSIMMKWDNGSSLSLVPGTDSFHIITQEETISEEPDMEMQL
jgi:hypothetical protein